MTLPSIQSLERRIMLTIFAPDITFGSGGVAETQTYIGTLVVDQNGQLLGLGSGVEAIDFDNEYFASTVTLNTDGSNISETGSDSLSDGFWFYGGPRYYLESFDNDGINGHQSTDNIHAFGGDDGDFGVEPVPTSVKYSDPYDSVRATFVAALPDGTLYLDILHQL